MEYKILPKSARLLVLLLGIFLGLEFTMAGAMPASVSTNGAGALVLTGHFGDLNDDGRVDVLDVVILTHHLTATIPLPSLLTNRADLDQDGLITLADRRILANFIAGRFLLPQDDFDEDELSNAEEFLRGTNPLNPDTDGDGSLDGWEVTEGTDPLNAQSRVPMTVVARPAVVVIHPLIQNTDGVMTATVVARPPVTVVYPLIQDTDTNRPLVLARPPVVINAPDPINAESAGMTVVAGPPVKILYPLLQNTDLSMSATTLAGPPVKLLYPLVQNSDSNAPATVLAQPPVKVNNPNR